MIHSQLHRQSHYRRNWSWDGANSDSRRKGVVLEYGTKGEKPKENPLLIGRFLSNLDSSGLRGVHYVEKASLGIGSDKTEPNLSKGDWPYAGETYFRWNRFGRQELGSTDGGGSRKDRAVGFCE